MSTKRSSEVPSSTVASANSDDSHSSSPHPETSSSLSGCNASTETSESKEDTSVDKSDASGHLKEKKGKNTNDLSNGGKVGKEDPRRHRVIHSRYKQAATGAARHIKNTTTLNATHLSSPSSSGSSFDNSRKMALATFKNSPAKQRLATSMGDISRFSRLPNKMDPQHKKNLASKAKMPKGDVPARIRSNQKLHSTALHCTTLLDKTAACENASFSTTVVGGKYFSRKQETTLPELSEFSLIQPPSLFGGSNEASELTVVSVSSEKEEKSGTIPNVSPVTEENLQEEYLRYLTWAFIDNKSEETYNKQVAEAEAQLTFLTHAIAVKEKEYLEAQKRRQLIQWYKKVSEDSEVLKGVVTKLAESSAEAATMSEKLGIGLENRLHEIKLEDIYIPDDQEGYCYELMDTLAENCSLLDELNAALVAENDGLGKTSDTIMKIQETVDLLKPCVNQAEKVVSLAIQESSLKLTLESTGPCDMHAKSL